MQLKKILVPVDFSEHAAEAVRVAAELSRRFEAPLTLAYVFQPISYLVPEGFLMYAPNQLESFLASIEPLLASAKKDAEAAGAIAVETKQLQGIPAHEITELAKREAFDLIVMGSHGRTGLSHALIGSVAERVVRHAPCPVLTVRGHAANTTSTAKKPA